MVVKKKYCLLLFLALFIVFLGMFSTSSLAVNEWDLEFEKQTYICLKEPVTTNTSSYKIWQPQLFTDTMITQLWADIYNTMQNSNYSQEVYKYMYMSYNKNNKTLTIGFADNFEIYNDTYVKIKTNYTNSVNMIYYTITFDSQYNISSKTSLTEYSNNLSRQIQQLNESITGNGFYLSKNITNIGTNLYNRWYTVSYATNVRHTFLDNNQNDNVELNLAIQNVNFDINTKFDRGSFWQSQTIDFYYYDTNNNKVSISQYITLNPVDYWWGIHYEPYIYYENLQYIPANKQIYINIKMTHNPGIANNIYYSFQPTTTIDLGEYEAFYTTNSTPTTTPTPTPTPSGDSGSGDNVPYPTPIDYTGQLNEINNNMPTSGDILNIVSGETNKIIGFFSGEPTVSDDDFSNSFNSSSSEIDDLSDPTSDFFTWFFNQIRLSFQVESNQQLRFTIIDNDFVINSDDYIFNIPVLENILGWGLGIFLLYGIFQDIRREIEKVKEGKFENIANDDISANMM